MKGAATPGPERISLQPPGREMGQQVSRPSMRTGRAGQGPLDPAADLTGAD